MLRALVRWFKSENLLEQAKLEVYEMLREDFRLFEDSNKLFWTGEGASIDQLRERDKQINRFVRDVRKKVLTHLAFSGSGGLDTALVMISLVVYIERIGDYTKDIGYLATDYPGQIKASGLTDEIKQFSDILSDRIRRLITIFDESEDAGEAGSKLTSSHKSIDVQYRELLNKLITGPDLGFTPGESIKLALYLRYLRRVEGHIFNIASAEVNPFHRISFKVKDQEKS